MSFNPVRYRLSPAIQAMAEAAKTRSRSSPLTLSMSSILPVRRVIRKSRMAAGMLLTKFNPIGLALLKLTLYMFAPKAQQKAAKRASPSPSKFNENRASQNIN